MLKTTRLFDKLALGRNNNSKLVFSKNNNSKPAFKKNNSNNKVNRFGIDRNDIEYIKKLEKSFKLGKKLLKSRNLTNFGTMEAKPKFLTSNTKTVFNRL